MWTSVPCPAVRKSRLPLECRRFGVTATTNFIFPRCVLFYFLLQRVLARRDSLSSRLLSGCIKGRKENLLNSPGPTWELFFHVAPRFGKSPRRARVMRLESLAFLRVRVTAKRKIHKNILGPTWAHTTTASATQSEHTHSRN